MKRKRYQWFLLIMLTAFSILNLRHTVQGAEYPNLGIVEPVYEDEENNIPYLGEDEESRARGASPEHWDGSKKGLQENEFYLDTDYQSLGVKHVLLNIVINECITYSNGSYHLANQSYVAAYKPMIQKMNAEGISVTAVILMRWPGDGNLQKLVYPGARKSGYSYYNLNCEDSTGKNAWKTIFQELVSTFGKSDCHVDRWVLGNEVNQIGPECWNYTGSNNLSTNVKAYANVFKVLDQAIASKYPAAKAFISFDHNWTATDTGHSCKSFLDSFAAQMGSYPWSVAWHPYAPVLNSAANVGWEQKVIWNSPGITQSINSRYICASNLTVLTNYIKNNWGSSHRVILSEQGYDASGSLPYQAAFIAYTYYAAQYNNMVDAVQFRSYADNPGEGGLKFGIVGAYATQLQVASNRAAYIAAHKRPAYDVFKYMDTNQAGEYTASCLQSIGAREWRDLIPSYTGPSSIGYWEKISGKWYFYKQGTKYSGWIKWNKKWYYLNPNADGAMATGLITISWDGTYCLAADGSMYANKWQLVSGTWYYLTASGRAQKGWLKNAGSWYYLDKTTGAMVQGWQTVGGKTYYFVKGGSGRMLGAGWHKINNVWYYMQKSGAVTLGWLKNNGSWYYMNPKSGAMTQGWTTVSGELYYLQTGGSGKMLGAGWHKIDNTWYYMKSYGAAAKGWLKKNGSWYYMNPKTGAMTQGWATVGGKFYYLRTGNSGKMLSGGWKKLDGFWYYLETSGAAKVGWFTERGSTYYLQPENGAMVTGWRNIGGIDCYFNASGVYIQGQAQPGTAEPEPIDPEPTPEETPEVIPEETPQVTPEPTPEQTPPEVVVEPTQEAEE